MKISHSPVRLLSLSFLVIGLGTGCTTVRENIISSVNTGFGLQVTENPQTQIPEVKIGYIRSQCYSIPTAKTVGEMHNKLSPTANTPLNDPSKTPQLVSGIRAGAKKGGAIIGMEISENFAVGETAVNSQAAIAMYIAQAESPEAAKAANSAVKSATANLAARQESAINLVANITDQTDKFDDTKLDTVAELAQATDLLNKHRCPVKVDQSEA